MVNLEHKVRVLGASVHVVDLAEAAQIIVTWVAECRAARISGRLPACRYVVTPNLDHAVMLRTNPDFREAYVGASLSVADGMPLVWASKMFGNPLPGRVPGSDLVPDVFVSSPAGTTVFLLGASEESSKVAAQAITERYPQLRVVGRLSPPMGFEHSADWSGQIVDQIEASAADLVIVGLGAPKQELWVARHASRLPGTTVLCAGATIDFLSGTVQRAPVWAQRTGLEWFHRMVSDPKRLIKRYTKDAVYFPLLLANDAWAKWGNNSSRSSHLVPQCADSAPEEGKNRQPDQ